MNRLAFVVLICALGLAHTATVKPTAKPASTGKASAVVLQKDCRPSLKDIQLVREHWKKEVSRNPKIAIDTLVEMIKANPDIKAASPALKDVALKDLPKNPAFLKRAFFLYGFLMNFIVNTLDDEATLRDALQRVEAVGAIYVPGVEKDKQNKESIKAYLKEIAQEEKDTANAEIRAAWANCLNYAISFMGRDKPENPVTGTSVLTPEELVVLRTAFKEHANKASIPIKAFRKLFDYHPLIFKAFQERVPMLAGTTVEELDENHPMMKFLAANLISATGMIIMNADNDELLVKMIKKNSKEENFVDYVDPKYQLDEFRRLLMEAAKEEEIPEDHIVIWNKLFKHVFDVMALHTLSPKQIENAKTLKNMLSNIPHPTGPFKRIIRDSWAAAKRNSAIAPKTFLKLFDKNKDILASAQIPQLATITREKLAANQNFLMAAYGFFGSINDVVNALDDVEVIALQMWKQSLSHWYVFNPKFREQSEAVAEAFITTMDEELGDLFGPEQKKAWTMLFAGLTEAKIKIQGTIRPLTPEDKLLIQDTWGIVKRNENFGNDVVLKFLRSHPLVAKRIPQLKDVKISDLPTNEKFKTYGAGIVKVLDGLIEHIDDPEWRKEHAKEANLKQYIVPKIPARLQLTEYAETLVDAIDEELGPRSSRSTRKSWTRAARNLVDLIVKHLEADQ